MLPTTMRRVPDWVAGLREDAGLSTELGLRWLDEDEQEATRELWRSTWNQVPYGEEFHARGAERIETSIPLAEGPVRHRRLSKAASRLVLVADPAEPDVAWLNLSHALPPDAWAVAGATPGEVRRAVSYYTPEDSPWLSALERVERLVKPIEVESLDVIKRGIEGLELWMDDATWGSAFVDDPWRDVDPDAGMMSLTVHLRSVGEQARGRRTSVGYRTLWSRSVLTIEEHPFGLYVFELRYRPAADRRAVEKLAGSEPGARLPPDLPVDLAASLLRGGSFTRESIGMNEERSWGPFELATLCALDPGEASTVAKLREAVDRWAGDEQMRGLVEVLHAYDHQSLLFECAAATQDDEVRGQLARLLAPPPLESETEAEDEDEEVAS
jgi:hypothetical protein